MNRAALGSLFLAIGLVATAPSRADDVIWRPVGGQPTYPSPIVTPVIVPVVANIAPASRDSGSLLEQQGWIRISAKPTDSPPSAANPAPSNMPAMPDAAPTVTLSKTPAPNSTTAAPTVVMTRQEVSLPAWQASAEYLLWWAKGSQVPPLLTTSPPPGANGVNGSVPGSTVLIAGEDLDDSSRQGARFGVVYWLDSCNLHGFDGRLFFTGQQDHTAVVNSLRPDGTDTNLFRPFFAPNSFVFGTTTLPGPFSERVTGTGISSGSFTAAASSFFWGADVNYRDCLFLNSNWDREWRVDMLVGFRYLHLDEDLTLTEDFVRRSASPTFPDEVVGTRVVVVDQFATTNNFYGGQVGATTRYQRDKWSVDLRTTVALGVTHEELTIAGGQNRAPLLGGGSFTAVGGLLALPGTNIGRYQRDVLSVVPEIGINVGYQVTPKWRALCGYNFLYWNNLARPGDQIDTTVDVTRIPRFVPPNVNIQPTFPPRPAVLFQNTDFWAQGVSLGAEYRW